MQTLKASTEGTLRGVEGEGPGDQTSWKKISNKQT